MNPEEHFNDPTYRNEIILNLLEMSKIIVMSKFCYYICIESALSNPYRDRRYDLQYHHPNCGMCPSCRGERLVPKVHRVGLTRVIFDVFNPGAAANPNVSEEIGHFTLEYLTTKIREYPNVNYLILKSNAQGGISPASIHQVLFLLITTQIIGMHYHPTLKTTIFSLSRAAPGAASFALMDDRFWEFIELKR